jgi:hypothetical protein
MIFIRRAIALTAATAMAALVTVAASACGGATTATGATTNGLEKKSAADVLQEAAAALKAAKSVHIVVTQVGGDLDLRMQDGSTTGTFAKAGAQVRVTIIGRDGYAKADDQAGLKMIGVPKPVRRHAAGRWLKVPAQGFTGLTIAEFASALTAYYGPLEPKVRQATLNGRKVVVVSWRNGSKLHVANTGPAYPLRAEFKGQHSGLIEFSEYGVPLHITAPSNAIDVSNAG